MFTVHSLAPAILFCVVTMLGWGSWANTQKLAGKTAWPFELFYWDYAIGVFLLSIVFMFTLGSMGSSGMTALENLRQASHWSMAGAMFSGALFNIANILLVVAIDAAGMSVAFPVGIGLALVIGTFETYVETPKGNPVLLFTGVALVVVAMVMSALAHRKLPRHTGRGWMQGLVFSVVAGLLMGFFYPHLVKSTSPNFNTAPIQPGYLTPYTALFFVAVGLILSNIVVNTIFMKAGGKTYGQYFAGTMRLHSVGVLGGVIWMVALTLNIIASGVAGPAISYALGQGATLVAAIWGVVIWKEFRAAPAGTMPLIVMMFAGYALGLILIGVATL
ncbi:MAG: AcrB/AcrD/AcrF family protein [Acidobacteriaceae bacterium]|nr:AcrB/AcrD/AcrF family protein [Acidobacteriaceae bacterium]MBV9779578.1 AcrB/AcrD/AcrF family protein [Acidobacteriaceae bacterium]